MNNCIVKISYEKYQELYYAVDVDNTVTAGTEWTRMHYDCDVLSAPGGIIELKFDNEQDCIWFQLKHP